MSSVEEGEEEGEEKECGRKTWGGNRLMAQFVVTVSQVYVYLQTHQVYALSTYSFL